MKLENMEDVKKVVRFSLPLSIISLLTVVAAFWMMDAKMDLTADGIPFIMIAFAVALSGSTPFMLITNHGLKLKELKAEKKPVE